MSNETTNTAVPKLRFPEFKNSPEWFAPTLGEISDRVVEKVGSLSQLPPVSITAGTGFILQAEKFGRDISGEQYKNYTLLRKGELAYNKGNSKRFPEGCIYQLKEFEKAAAPNVFLSFRFKEGFFPDFYQGYFDNNFHGKQLQQFITSGARSNGLLNISSKAFFSIVLPTPHDVAEQQKIAATFSSLNDLITAQIAKLDALKEYKRGLMQGLFPAEGETVPKLRFPEFQDAEEWEEKKLGEVATFLNGRAYQQAELLDSGKYKVLRLGNLFSNNHWYYSDLELEENKYCDKGDLLYAWSASFGPRMWTGEKVIYHYHIWKVIEKKGIGKQFLFVLLDYETNRIKDAQANGLGMLHITKGSIEAWKCLIPKHEEEQKRIAACLSSLDDRITAQSQKIEALKLHKKGLMQGLFPALLEAAV